MKSADRISASEVDSPISAHWFRQRAWLLALLAAALIYALLAGLRKVSDFDLFWQLATGRWVAQHHAVFSTDVFSYTASGQPWIYPVGSGLIFFATFLLGGYSLISWLGAMACVGTVALLIRRASLVTAMLAIIAVPAIALRTNPRADMFTIVLFAAFLSILWESHEYGSGKLWLLPLLMMAWVNLHLGFFAGLAMSCLYAAAEAVRLVRGRASQENRSRLKLLALWLAALFTATLVNPWGWNIYRAISRQEAAMTVHSAQIKEWVAIMPGWGLFKQALVFRNPDSSFAWLLFAGFLAMLVAAFRRKWFAALLLAGSCWLALRHLRFVAEMAAVVVVIGGAVLTAEMKNERWRFSNERLNKVLGAVLAVAILLFACLRSADLVTNRYYFSDEQFTSFGAGLSWWFPDRAMAFIEREKLPARIFNGYEEGGFLLWKLGPEYSDYIDGRAIPFGPYALDHLWQLQHYGPDSPLLLRTADSFGINTIVFALGRNNALERVSGVLPQYCVSESWRPVYLDETSAVFLRRTLQNQTLIERYPVDCATAQIPRAGPTGGRAEEFNRWANAATLLQALNRNQDAVNASNQALSIFGDSTELLDVRSRALLLTGHPFEAERDLLRSAALQDQAATWSQLAAIYHAQHRYPETLHALQHLATLQPHPEGTLLNLGYVYIEAGKPMDALAAFDRAQAAAPAENGNTVLAEVDDGRALAMEMLGNVAQATHFEEEATSLAPQVPNFWTRLAHLYQVQGRTWDASRAGERASALSANPAH